MTSYSHISVLKDEVLHYMAPKDGEVYVDGTFGAGGHSRALLEAADCVVYGMDRDPNVKEYVEQIEKDFGDRFIFIHGQFGNIKKLLNDHGVEKVDGILLDIGVSSMQIDNPERGFSFMKDGPLDMRMSENGSDAAALVNDASEEELAGIIFKYGGERKSRHIARAIINARVTTPITRTGQLVDIVKKAVGGYNDTINPATRTFQALRIWVNNELGELEEALESSESLLNAGGRLAVITFHSGEDQIVKYFIDERSGKQQSYSRHQPIPVNDNKEASLKKVTRKAVAPSDRELETNVRARSAKLRVAQRTDAPCWN